MCSVLIICHFYIYLKESDVIHKVGYVYSIRRYEHHFPYGDFIFLLGMAS